MLKNIFLLLVLFPSSYATVAQTKCNCVDYAILKKTNANDSIIAANLINSSALICKAKGFEIMGNYFLKASLQDTAELLLQKAEAAL